MNSRDGKNWTRRALKNRINLYGIAHGNGLFVAVGDGDWILTSLGGATWRAHRAPTSDVLLAAVAFSAGTFVVVGDSGTILTSTNGIEWQKQNSGTSAHLNTVVPSPNGFVAAASGLAWTSPDGTTWTEHDFAVTNR